VRQLLDERDGGRRGAQFSRYGFNTNNPDYVQFFKLPAIPQPTGIFVFLDEHPDSINDGYFLHQADDPAWIDLPASYHNGAAGFFVRGWAFRNPPLALSSTNDPHGPTAPNHCRGISPERKGGF